ncbi:hypothetical protein CEUSTIGMA_g10105.t1 [Chlamydomonas eustigma]|uniref:Serine-threonine kinase receptor-associated protein n=1 Tax=Chlamydomonas eustigma TaxID=1157962 RepID=A0A250XID9_9CHLO|nr:hypothetical protein CEUSTIGMA_g10105.t1 [Chlamydomonas eustigma]|eukprot:GAX82679.1 hypothetical protein CEUSTIGMA_g10105.t1 [Chlamydomonas eustigma]
MSKRLPIVCHGHSRPIVEVNYSNLTPDGYFLASASKDKTPMLRHGETGDWYGTFTGHKGAVWSSVLNHSALLCATASADFTARVWDACSGVQMHEFSHPHIVRTTSFSMHTDKLATGGHDKLIRIFDLGAPEAAPQMLPQTPSAVRNVVWLQEDNILICTLLDTPGINVYDMRTMQLAQSLPTAAPVTSIDVTYDQQVMTTAEGWTVRFFNTSTLSLMKQQELTHNAEAASFCPQFKRFVAGGEDMWVHLYNYETGEELAVNKGHHGPVHTLRFAPTYEAYASGSEDGTIRIWSLDSCPAVAGVENGVHHENGGST